MNEKTLVIFPTYNEAGNIAEAVAGALASGAEALVVDDNSPDGTAAAVDKLAAADGRVHLLKRPAKMGLGSAYIQGFDYALEHGYARAVTMDADLSHPQEKIPELAAGDDFVSGSRYIAGGSIAGWPLHRRLLSRFANLYAGLVLGAGISDLTSGFNCISARALKDIRYGEIKSEGYGFLIELKYRALTRGYAVREVPIEFRERKQGRSKLGRKIIWEAFWLIPRLRLGK